MRWPLSLLCYSPSVICKNISFQENIKQTALKHCKHINFLNRFFLTKSIQSALQSSPTLPSTAPKFGGGVGIAICSQLFKCMIKLLLTYIFMSKGGGWTRGTYLMPMLGWRAPRPFSEPTLELPLLVLVLPSELWHRRRVNMEVQVCYQIQILVWHLVTDSLR